MLNLVIVKQKNSNRSQIGKTSSQTTDFFKFYVINQYKEVFNFKVEGTELLGTFFFFLTYCRTRPTLSGKQKRQLQEKLKYIQEVVKTKKVSSSTLTWSWRGMMGLGFNVLFSPSRKTSTRNICARVLVTMTWMCKGKTKKSSSQWLGTNLPRFHTSSNTCLSFYSKYMWHDLVLWLGYSLLHELVHYSTCTWHELVTDLLSSEHFLSESCASVPFQVIHVWTTL